MRHNVSQPPLSAIRAQPSWPLSLKSLHRSDFAFGRSKVRTCSGVQPSACAEGEVAIRAQPSWPFFGENGPLDRFLIPRSRSNRATGAISPCGSRSSPGSEAGMTTSLGLGWRLAAGAQRLQGRAHPRQTHRCQPFGRNLGAHHFRRFRSAGSRSTAPCGTSSRGGLL